MSLKCNIKTLSKRRRIKEHVASSIQADLWLQQRQGEKKKCCITEISQCHCFNLSGGWKASASECITTSRPNMAARFNEIMTKSQRLAIWLGVKDRQCTALCEEDNNRRKELFPPWWRPWWMIEGGGGKVMPWRLLSLTVQWLPARLQQAQNGAGRAGMGGGGDGKVGEMGTVKTATRGGGRRQCIEK